MLYLDIFKKLNEDGVDYLEAINNKETIEAGGVNIPVISIEDLKKLKRAAGRPQDLADIESLDNLLMSNMDQDEK